MYLVVDHYCYADYDFIPAASSPTGSLCSEALAQREMADVVSKHFLENHKQSCNPT